MAPYDSAMAATVATATAAATPVKFSAQPSNDVIVNGTTQIEFDNVGIDTHSGYSAAENTYTIQVAGDYLVAAMMTIQSNTAAGGNGSRLYSAKVIVTSDGAAADLLYGTIQLGLDGTPSEIGTINMTTIHTFAVGDVIQVQNADGDNEAGNDRYLVNHRTNISLLKV